MSDSQPAQRITLPPGPLATDKTIDLMAKAAMGRFGAQSPRIRALAIRIIREAGVPPNDKRGEIDAIHGWVMGHLRYVNDPLWMETISYPEHLAFVQRDGDCDDHVVLEAALLGAIGVRTRSVTIAPVPGPMSHVYQQAMVMADDGTGQGTKAPVWINLDPIVKKQPSGWAVPNPYAIRVYPMNTPDGIGLSSAGSLMTTLMGLAGVLRWLR